MKNNQDNKTHLSRRGFFTKFGATGGLVLGTMACGDDGGSSAGLTCDLESAVASSSLHGDPLEKGGIDFGGEIGAPVERTAVPTACWQCVARDAAIGHVEDGKLIKMEGNPAHLRTAGKLCAKGQGGPNQLYDPDRLLTPMLRSAYKTWLDSGTFPANPPTADRGTASGDWVEISWDEAKNYMKQLLGEIVDDPKQLFFHYGRMKASASKIIKSHLLKAFGTESIGNHTAICESAKWTAQELTWGGHYDINDVKNANLILNFGCNPYVAHTSHIPLSQRVSSAVQDGAELHTFDVRLSNTAAKSTKWYPIQPGTDLAIVLALCHELVNNHASAVDATFINTYAYAGEYDSTRNAYASAGSNLAIITAWLNGEGYTPAWAEAKSSVPAADIVALAASMANNRPVSVLTYRGAVTHWNGIQTERAAQLLQSLIGGMNDTGGRVKAVGAKWSTSFSTSSNANKGKMKRADGIALSDGGADAYVNEEMGVANYLLPTHHASHQTFNSMVDEGLYPKIYLSYCYAPVFSNGDCNQNEAVLKDRSKIESVITCSTTFSEACELSDFVIPDATYMERWDWEDMVSYDLIREYYIRQPTVDPVMGVRDFKDFFRDVLNEMGYQTNKNGVAGDFWPNAEAFVEDACEVTSAVKDNAGGFSGMKTTGTWHDPAASPTYKSHEAAVDRAGLFTSSVLNADLVFTPDDPALPSYSAEAAGATEPSAGTPGVFWDHTATSAGYDPATTPLPVPSYQTASKGYVGYLGRGTYGGDVEAGFKPDKVNILGLMEVYSQVIAQKLDSYQTSGGDAAKSDRWVWPNWMDIPGHDDNAIGTSKFIMTTYKDRMHTHSRTQNCKVLSEFMHDNPLWINKASADSLGLVDGDKVTVTNTDMRYPTGGGVFATKTETITANIKITEGIHPKAVAMAGHVGHWQHGRYATAGEVTSPGGRAASTDPDLGRVWWGEKGSRMNLILPNAGDPIGGMLRYGDSLVTITKA